jgi:hypothetical protein
LALAKDEKKKTAPSRADQWANFMKYIDEEKFNLQFLFA